MVSRFCRAVPATGSDSPKSGHLPCSPGADRASADIDRKIALGIAGILANDYEQDSASIFTTGDAADDVYSALVGVLSAGVQDEHAYTSLTIPELEDHLRRISASRARPPISKEARHLVGYAASSGSSAASLLGDEEDEEDVDADDGGSSHPAASLIDDEAEEVTEEESDPEASEAEGN